MALFLTGTGLGILCALATALIVTELRPPLRYVLASVVSGVGLGVVVASSTPRGDGTSELLGVLLIGIAVYIALRKR